MNEAIKLLDEASDALHKTADRIAWDHWRGIKESPQDQMRKTEAIKKTKRALDVINMHIGFHPELF